MYFIFESRNTSVNFQKTYSSRMPYSNHHFLTSVDHKIGVKTYFWHSNEIEHIIWYMWTTFQVDWISTQSITTLTVYFNLKRDRRENGRTDNRWTHKRTEKHTAPRLSIKSRLLWPVENLMVSTGSFPEKKTINIGINPK